MPPSPFATYLHAVQAAYRAGTATEHTYRPALQVLLEALGPGLTATNEPKRIAVGAPDYAITDATGRIVGYIEAKDIGLDLGAIERDAARTTPTSANGQQLRRYRAALPNLILTDYLDFHWWKDGRLRTSARLGQVVEHGTLTGNPEGQAAVAALLSDFLTQTAAGATNARDLAERMARLTDLMHTLILRALESASPPTQLRQLHQAFIDTLVPDLPPTEFADMYAQTLAYGLFAARANHRGPQPFARRTAAHDIPRTNPFLRRLFNQITGPDLEEEPYVGLVDELAQLLAATNMNDVLADFGHRTRQEDPVVHFYETFLAAYDPRLREKRGVYYTPEPVVSYIVRSVDHLLRTRFACRDGLADTSKTTTTIETPTGTVQRESHRVLILDPATGTGTFLYAVIDQIRQAQQAASNAGLWPEYVRAHLLPRLFGFELLMAPYAVAHLKLGLQLAGRDLPPVEAATWGYTFAGDERLGVYLTNTLDEAHTRSQLLLGQYIADEANAAASIKRDSPIMVVLGNPPYSGHSANTGEWISGLVRDYYRVDGEPLGERNPKWLQDDYVKFLRFGQWRVAQSGQGILAFITNHGYLDNPTFRGMRRSLMQTFSDIYLLNLHGNSKKRETSPDGSPDENVFDIQQGVAIGIFVKDPHSEGPARVHYADLWGTREGKYEVLAEADIAQTEWQEIAPSSPFYLFVPQNVDLRGEYEQGWSIPDIMLVNSVGIVTGQDSKTIALDHQGAEELARQQNIPISEVKIILYRPFDRRFVVYDKSVVTRTRSDVMRHMLTGDNMALITSRLTKGETFQHAQVSRNIVEVICMSPKTSNNGFVFPLYLYPARGEDAYSRATAIDAATRALPYYDPERDRLSVLIKRLYPAETYARWPNLHPDFLAAVESRLKLAYVPDGVGDLTTTFGPEAIFHYLYAVLHNPTYRARYAEFLRGDFPRVPLPSDASLFATLAGLGAQLVRWHLLDPATLAGAVLPSYPIHEPDAAVRHRIDPGFPKYVAPGTLPPGETIPAATGRVYLNRTQYFAGITSEVWVFHIGGYQVAEKWLKDRRGRQLTEDRGELTHYRQICAALAATAALMEQIDAALPLWPWGRLSDKQLLR